MKAKLTLLLMAFAVLLMSATGKAQQTVQLDILQLQSEGMVSMTMNNNFNTNQLFDNRIDNWPSSWKVDPFIITLEFKNTQIINRSGVWMEDGDWELEGANSLTDLKNKTGSYVKMVNHASPNTEQAFSPKHVKFLRMTSNENPAGDDVLHINEWKIYAQASINFIQISPADPKMVAGSSFDFKAQGRDQYNNSYELSGAQWKINGNQAIVNSDGRVTALVNGNCEIEVTYNGMSGSTPLEIKDDFRLPLAPTKQVRVSLVIENPPIASRGNKRLHELFNWRDPKVMANELVAAINESSEGVVNYQIVETIDDDVLFTKTDNVYLQKEEVAALLSEPGWPTLKERHDSGRTHYDYGGLIKHYNLDTKRDAGQIHEVWVYSWPYAAMGEAAMAGEGAFFINGPVLHGMGGKEKLPIMGYNYERGTDQAYHSYCHRVESTMRHLYGRWDHKANPLNKWEIFAFVDRDNPGWGHNGNCHFPVNADKGYEYSSYKNVTSWTDSWDTYPFLGNKSRTLNCTEWQCDHLGYQKWWHSRLPKFEGIDEEGKLNNWWHYVADFDDALEMAAGYANQPTYLRTNGTDCNGLSSFSWNGVVENGTIVVSTDNVHWSDQKVIDISGRRSIVAGPEDFSNWKGGMIPGQVYYWGIWDGTTFTRGGYVKLPGKCPLNLSLKAPSCLRDSMIFSWWGTGESDWEVVVWEDSMTNVSRKSVAGVMSTSGYSFTPALNLKNNTTYYWGIFDGDVIVEGNSFHNGSVAAGLPFREDFEANFFPAANWELINPDGKQAWQRGTSWDSIGRQHTLTFNNYSSNYYGARDQIFTPKLDLSSKTTGANMTFKVAYKRAGAYNSDTLAVYATKDCGATLDLLYLKGGEELSTSPGDKFLGTFYPKYYEWRTEEINLNAYAGEEIMIVFENRSGYGQVLRIDNINIVGAELDVVNSIEKGHASEDYKVYPNPSKGIFNILLSDEIETAQVAVYDLLGKEILTQQVNNKNVQVNLSNYPKGMYILRVQADGVEKVNRILIE